MARSAFSLYRRPTKKKPGYTYYVQFWLPEERSYRPGISIASMVDTLGLDPRQYRPSQKCTARLVAEQWIEKGWHAQKSTSIVLTGDFLLTFWDWERSDYIKAKLARKAESIGKAYCQTNHSWIRRYVVPDLGATPLLDLTPHMIERLLLKLSEKSGLNTRTINYILQAIRVPMNEAFRMGQIPKNPCLPVKKFGITNFERGILSADEVQTLLGAQWDDQRCFVAFQVAVAGGLRLGEILALQPKAIAKDHILVAHSYSKTVGLKTTKTNKSRIVPLPQEIIAALHQLASVNPWKNQWIFYSTKSADYPITDKSIEDGFYRAIARIGIVDDKSPTPAPGSRQGRKISFHSLRHYCNAMLRGVLGDEKLRMLTGHSDIKMTNHYDHITDRDLALIRKAQEETILNRG